ncbi:DUF1657 domain-containing protein [Bacillus sp. DNRA2]|uniref:DUF1657 domain-containing protein n=1 Tax=Bacillus sp. DNRA2 TaxID=2723053 RepID=UPI00145E63C0|nr:DUF1657 domain-containing protein [Bacillus sp. DNRA2]NMD69925.1 DUF1657 domain-containing protein [Bacillus sp. DNRA2]
MNEINFVQQTLATVKGIESQLSTLAINSIDPKTQQIFHEAMLVVQDIKQDLLNHKHILG